MDASTSISIFTKIMAKIKPFSWLVGWFFPEKKMIELLDVQPPGATDCVVLQHSSRSATCWLAFSNFSPFVLTIDRLEVKVFVDGASATLHRLLPERLTPAERKSVLSEGIFVCSPEGLALAQKTDRVRLEVRGYVTSAAKNFVFTKYFDYVKNFEIHG